MAIDTSKLIDLDRLQSTLLTSKVQQTNNALFQVITQLIKALKQLEALIVGGSTNTNITQIINQLSLGSLDGDGSGGNESAITSPGPKGDKGDIGPLGIPGLDGLNGEDGFGFQGLKGDAGIAGLIGISGEDGIDGLDGISIKGDKGDTGATGAAGTSGIIGPAGLDGEDGEASFIPGPQGLTGATGAAGSAGAAGSIGPPGIDGEIGELIEYILLSSGGSSNPTEQTTTSTGTQNNFSLSAAFTFLRCNNASALTFTGFSNANAIAPNPGDRVLVVNIGTSTVKVNHQDTNSIAAHRIICPSTNGQILGAGGCLFCIYDGTTARWREEIIEPGTAINVTFNAGDYTASGAMTWTVDAADQVGFSYFQRGSILTINLLLNSTTVGGVLNNELRVAIPGGFTSFGSAYGIGWGRDAGTGVISIVQVLTAATYMQIYKSGFANYAAAVNTTDEAYSMFFPVN